MGKRLDCLFESICTSLIEQFGNHNSIQRISKNKNDISFKRKLDGLVVLKCCRSSDHINIALSYKELSHSCMNRIQELESQEIHPYIKLYGTFDKRKPFICFYASRPDPNNQGTFLEYRVDDILDICQIYLKTINLDNISNTNNQDVPLFNYRGANYNSLKLQMDDSHIEDSLNIEGILTDTCRELHEYLKNNNQQHGGLVFPVYSPFVRPTADRDRLSEQELKQRFIHHLSIVSPNISYSVETPTIDGYSFKNAPTVLHHQLLNTSSVDDEDDLPINILPDEVTTNSSKGGQSARFDLTLYDFVSRDSDSPRYTIRSHIEFKQGAVTPHEIIKDLLKLSYEPYCPEIPSEYRERINNIFGCDNNLKYRNQYFIHILDAFNQNTIYALTRKYFNLNNELIYNINGEYREVYENIARYLDDTHNRIYIFILTININQNPEIYRINYGDSLKHFITASDTSSNNIQQVNLNDIWKRIL